MSPHFKASIATFAVLALGCVLGFSARSAEPRPNSFLSEMNMSMMNMDAAMQIHPSGDVDRDFVAMMTPHHQGAIEMAQLELRYGHSEQLRHIAQEIIVDQQQEISAIGARSRGARIIHIAANNRPSAGVRRVHDSHSRSASSQGPNTGKTGV